MPTTMRDVVRFIKQIATEDEVSQILDALDEANGRIESAADGMIRLGSMVRMRAVTPDYLNGLEGIVTSINEEGLGAVELTPDSTGALRFMPDNTDFPVRGCLRYEIPDVPLSYCELARPACVAA